MGITCAQKKLNNHLRLPEPSVHHEIQAAERLVGPVDALQQVKQFKAEVDDEDIKEIGAKSAR
jgi:hypothetical protein